MHASAGFRESNYGGDSDMKQYVTSRWMGALALALVIAPGLLAQDAKLSIVTVASTVPSNGDVNPYGVAVVPASIGCGLGPVFQSWPWFLPRLENWSKATSW